MEGGTAASDSAKFGVELVWAVTLLVTEAEVRCVASPDIDSAQGVITACQDSPGVASPCAVQSCLGQFAVSVVNDHDVRSQAGRPRR